MNHVKFIPDQIQNGRLIAIFFAKIDKIFEILSVGINISPTPMNISSRYSTHALTTILPWILWSFVRIKFKIADLSPFLFSQIAKIFENFVRPDEYLQHQWILFSDTLHMHLLQSSHKSCEVSSGSNSKWSTSHHFCLLKLTNYLKICTSGWISPIFVSDNLHMHLLTSSHESL